MIPIEIDENITSLLSNIQKKSKNCYEAFDSIGQRLSESTRHRFTSKTAPDGQPWKPSKNNPNTLVSNRKEGINKLSVITHHATQDRVTVGSAGGVSIKTGGLYGRIHQLGGKAGRNHSTVIPARPYLGISAEDVREIEAVLNAYLKQV